MGKTPIGIIVHFRSHYTFHVVVEIIGGLSPCLFAWEGFYTSINFRLNLVHDSMTSSAWLVPVKACFFGTFLPSYAILTSMEIKP